MLASYNKETGFSGIKKSFSKLNQIQIPKDVSDALSVLDEGTIKASKDIDGLLGKLKLTDSSAVDFAKGIKNGSIALKEGQTMLQGYEAYLKTTGAATEGLAIKTKVLSAATKALSSIGWMLAITAATALITKGIDYVVNYEKRLKEASDEIISSYKEEVNETFDKKVILLKIIKFAIKPLTNLKICDRVTKQFNDMVLK